MTQNNKKVLITGASGQLGYELERTAPSYYELILCDLDTLDITQLNAIEQFVDKQKPDIIINAAAYTAVDKAEEETNLAWQVNHLGAENLAKIATAKRLKLIHISTDFIFDGKQSNPYLEEAYNGSPISVYGESKLAGEKSVLTLAPKNSLIIRTAWLYSAHGNNFVKSMLRLMQSQESLGIVADQIGTPTWAKTLAEVIWMLENNDEAGVYHCSDNGVASWYDFSVNIQKIAVKLGLLDKRIPIKAIKTENYPLPAARPAYSVMDKTKTEISIKKSLPHWQDSLENMLKEL